MQINRGQEGRRCVEAGFSLVECCVVLAIAGVFVGLAIPQFGALVTRYREQAVVTEFASELRTARLAALSRRETVEVSLTGSRDRLEQSISVPDPMTIRQYDFSGRGMTVTEWPASGVVRFYASGRTASPHRLTLQGAAARRWTVTVTITGRVHIS